MLLLLIFSGTISGNDEIVRGLMSSAWTNFAIFGDPTPPGTSSFSWTPVDPNSELQQYLNISGVNPTMTTSQEIQNRMKIWNEVMITRSFE